ncbi:hypothetical protein [Streptacidiphilus jiangxiensis]|uniref:Uncharacterized protein n=1 Tax=Streptacidiphilus jiangxiensis TaxID=235985 RepID=A0A1H7VA34_STRJI|nr:hypothetical protein [Streptacidiphilus jiangxiensis]SEM05930.1 hypothetical protein SAMN05414137_117182 [Streptacidiphilus jiangxiensis]
MNPYGLQPPPQAPTRRGVGAVVAAGVVLGLVAGAVNALFSFGMVFATDSCGTGAPSGNAAICDGGTWTVVVALPWAGLLVGVGAGLAVAVARVRQGRSAWPGPLVGAGVYAVLLAVALLVVLG